MRARYTKLTGEAVARTVEVAPWLLLDVDASGRAVGVEVLGDHDVTDALFRLVRTGTY